MRKLIVFNQVSLDGYFTDSKGDMSFARKDTGDAEWNTFVSGNASGGGALVFGRITYEMMAGFWPTPMATQMMPVVAERMNNLPKVVFSRTLREASWSHTTLVKGDAVKAMRKMKGEPGPDMAILGSGHLVSQFAQHGLIDCYQIVVVPVALGRGRTLFDGVKTRIHLKLESSRAFGNGNVLLNYVPNR